MNIRNELEKIRQRLEARRQTDPENPTIEDLLAERQRRNAWLAARGYPSFAAAEAAGEAGEIGDGLTVADGLELEREAALYRDWIPEQ